MARIRQTDHWVTKAVTIFIEFDVHQSCTIVENGEKVWNEIINLDYSKNTTVGQSGQRVRRYKKYKNSSGAPIAQKIFRYSINNERWTIWRAQ